MTFSPLCPLQLLHRGWTLDLIPWTYRHTAPGLMPKPFWVELSFHSPCFYFLLMRGLKVYLLMVVTILLSLTSTKYLLLIFYVTKMGCSWVFFLVLCCPLPWFWLLPNLADLSPELQTNMFKCLLGCPTNHSSSAWVILIIFYFLLPHSQTV